MDTNNSFPKIVRLSVGGVHFTTSIDTLLSDSNSMLAAMFSGRHHVSKDEEGRYFIDRDGTHFRYILNFLRDGNTFIPYENQQLVDELYEEVCYFQIQDLQRKLEQEKNSHVTTMTYKIDYVKFIEFVNLSQRPLQAPKLRLMRMQLSNLDLSKGNFTGTDFSWVDASETNFSYAILVDCIFNDSTIKSIILKDARMDRASFKNANINSGDLRRAVCKQCNFSKAKLCGADLRDAEMSESNFSEANLLVANLERGTFFSCNFSGANLDRAKTKNAKGLPLALNNNNAINGNIGGV